MDIIDQNNNIVDINNHEVQEQLLAKKYIRKDDVVLELGARYGSVSCIINSKLFCKTNHIAVEPDQRVWESLERNKLANDCQFIIVKGFVSEKKLDLINLDVCHGGYGSTSIENSNTKIDSFTLQEIITTNNNIRFNVLVADCEGFLETFFDENPFFCDQLRLLIFEADYPKKCNYEKIREMLIKKGFIPVLSGFQNVYINPLYNSIYTFEE
jgi:FkbM family methyltransferase